MANAALVTRHGPCYHAGVKIIRGLTIGLLEMVARVLPFRAAVQLEGVALRLRARQAQRKSPRQ
jgi:hypothetical protein